jgi:choline dehydrogenase-like flavoprotein
MADLVKTYVRQRRLGTDVAGVLTIDARRRAEEGLANISSVLVPESADSASAGVHAIRELLAARRHNLIQGSWRDLQELLIDPDHRTAMARLLAPLNAVPADLRSIATTAFRRLTRRPAAPTVLQMLHTVEQVPNPDSRVVLSRDRDRLGNLRASLDWRPLAQDLETIAAAERIIDEALRDAGLGYVEGRYDGTKPLSYTGSWHHMGTTRMNNDPHHGVLDASCKVHGISNLFIAGSSVFPTGGYTTPTLTIVALALRLAEHLTTELKH